MKILVRAPNWIGDQLMAYPFFHYLRRTKPRAKIAVACVPWVADLQFRHLVDEVIVLDPPLPHQRSLLSKLQVVDRAARKIREQGPWDMGFSLPNSFGSAWFLWRSGCAKRVGYAAEARGWLLTDARSEESSASVHRSQAYLNLLFPPNAQSELGGPDLRSFWTLPAENELDPPIPGDVDEFPAEAAWPHIQAVEPPSEPYWILAPGSMADSRRWSEDRFVQFARQVAGETNWNGVIVGGPKEAPIAERLKQDRSLRLKDWTALGPVPGLWRLFRGAKFVIANDSGMAHFGAMMGAPTYIAWGAGDPRRTRPTGPTVVQIEVNAVECWPCERNTCVKVGAENLACIRGVSADTLWQQVSAGVLGRKPHRSDDVEL
ncbi:glycosyltransferase family 9 protein [bacterium]|nr:glycosyltransferase family 9 protein [bacterium]